MKEGFIRIPEYIDKYKISPAAKLLYGYMYEYGRRTGERLVISQSRIARTLNVCRKSASKYIGELADAGLMEKVDRGAGKVLEYRITGSEIDRFYMLPDSIFNSKSLTMRQKLILSKILSRARLSKENGLSSGNEVMFYYTIASLMEDAGVGRTTAREAITRLIDHSLMDRELCHYKEALAFFMDLSRYPVRHRSDGGGTPDPAQELADICAVQEEDAFGAWLATARVVECDDELKEDVAADLCKKRHTDKIDRKKYRSNLCKKRHIVCTRADKQGKRVPDYGRRLVSGLIAKANLCKKRHQNRIKVDKKENPLGIYSIYRGETSPGKNARGRPG